MFSLAIAKKLGRLAASAGAHVLIAVDALLALVARGVVGLYRRLLSPLLPPACRFYPTCSAYTDESLKRFGFFRGGYLAGRRICRCHPFHEGGEDPVPAAFRWRAGTPGGAS